MRQKHNEAINTKDISLPPRLHKIRKEIIKTLSYSDIFDYPLTGDQIFQFLGIEVKSKQFLAVLKTIPHKITNNTIYYFLPKKEKLVAKRLQKEVWSKKRLFEVKKSVSFLGFIPTIRFIGISGSLALKNADLQSDSDLFFICASHTVWLTRLIVYLCLGMLGLRRQRGKKKSKALCANMFLDEKDLGFSKAKQNLYVAHEILQVLPVVDRNNFYAKLLSTNMWVKKYFPNNNFPKMQRNSTSFSILTLLIPLEYVVRGVQLWYMKDRITRETVTQNRIAFHPIDYENITLSLYKKKTYGI